MRITHHRLMLWACVICIVAHARFASAGTSELQIPANVSVVGIHVEPDHVEITRKYDYVQLLLSADLDNGETLDVTSSATFDTSNENARVSELGVVMATTGVTNDADGQASEIVCRFGDHQLTVPVTIRDTAFEFKVDYIHDVMPVISKMGCTAGTCHGAKDGKNGFKLSLRGYDPIADTRSFTDDLSARRINRASPGNSLMLLKSTAAVPHAGGQLTKVGEPYYEIIRSWIAGGVKLDLSTPRVTRIVLSPTNPVVMREGMRQQMRVLATYADGEVRDVTHEAFISSSNGDVADADAAGGVLAKRRGEAPILARFEGAYTATTMTVMGDRDGFVWDQPPANNFIDDLVYQKLRRVKTLSSALCSDEDFVRRLHLDLIGLPPTVEVLQSFVNDDRDTVVKRDELIDQLVGSPAYVDHWTNKWADLLQVNRKYLGTEGAVAFRDWIRGRVADNTPYNDFAYSVLTANGSNRENPAASYYKILREPAAIMENTTHLFLATRFNCNKCHDHPFERWTQDQYYELTAFFARVGLKQDPDGGDAKIGGSAVEGAKPLYEVVFEKEIGEVTHDRTGEEVAPSFPYQEDLVGSDALHSDSVHSDSVHSVERNRRDQLAKWITSPENEYFAKSYVNRIWGYLLGRGIIEPIDDIRAGNPPTNPELLDALTERFVEGGFDTQALVRLICRSGTYQLSVQTNTWNADDELNYSHASPRRLPAEVLFDAIHQVTGASPNIPGVPPGTRAAQLPDVGVKIPGGFLDQFGRPARESSCECERSNGVMLGPIMALVNGPTISDALMDSQNAIATLVQSTDDDRSLVQNLFLRILNRDATPTEVDAGVDAIAAAVADEQRLQTDVGRIRNQLDEYRKTLPEKITNWESRQFPPEWHVLDLVEFSNTMGAALTKESDGSWLITGKNDKGNYEFLAHTMFQNITGFRVEVMADDRLPKNGPGRAGDGNLVLTEFIVKSAPNEDTAKLVDVKLKNAQATHSQNDFGVEKAIDGKIDDRGWALAQELGRDQTAIFETEEDIDYDSETLLSFALEQNYNSGKHSIGRFRISATTASRPHVISDPPQDLLVALNTAVADRTSEQNDVLLRYYRTTDAELQRLESELTEAERRVAGKRLLGAQDIAWALINSPAFLFNR